MKIHELKLDTEFFDDVKLGKKNFEIRKNDRNFEVGDTLHLFASGSCCNYYCGPHVKDKVKKHLFNIKKLVYPKFKGEHNKAMAPLLLSELC
ncbi:DUF3850 domain-containing protein [Lactococcus raffinolactis]|uniref:DUF3850 domain-containing protein n=1 Tax=Pseudolactococcus raffinolactis TaxID=1366 RepID=UPI001BB1AB10|nr:DUF3850 domain-containing protein [Lactococcus raffinolactis]